MNYNNSYLELNSLHWLGEIILSIASSYIFSKDTWKNTGENAGRNNSTDNEGNS